MAVASFYLLTYLNGSFDYCEGVALMNHPASSFPVQLMASNPVHVTFWTHLDSGQVGTKTASGTRNQHQTEKLKK